MNQPTPPSRLPRQGVIVRRLLRAALLALISLAGLEGTLRLLRDDIDALRIALSCSSEPVRLSGIDNLPTLLGRSIAGFRPFSESAGYVLNSRSFRTHEYTTDKPPGVFRVIALGDSFTFSSGRVPHAMHWPTLVEQRLTDDLGRPVEVLNLGVPAVGPRFERRLWQIEGARLHADLVILGFFVGNDFTEEQGRQRLGTQFPGWTERVAERSLLFRAIRNAYRLHHGVRLTGPAPAATPTYDHGGFAIESYRYDPQYATYTEPAFLTIQSDLMRYHLRGQRALFLDLCADVVATLRGMRDDVTAAGARLVVAIFPAEFQVDPAMARRAMGHVGRTAAEYDFDFAQQELGRQLTSADIEHVDLLPAFRAAAASETLYAPRDTHWNPRGTALAADVIGDTLFSLLKSTR